MKFSNHDYWKHEQNKDVFFYVSSVAFDDDGKNAVLNGSWCTQGSQRWWFTARDKLKIQEKDYAKWHPYEPTGSELL